MWVDFHLPLAHPTPTLPATGEGAKPRSTDVLSPPVAGGLRGVLGLHTQFHCSCLLPSPPMLFGMGQLSADFVGRFDRSGKLC